MRCDVICLVAFDFVLGIVFRRVMRVAFIIEISNVNGDDSPRHASDLGVPAHMIADLKLPCHRRVLPVPRSASPKQMDPKSMPGASTTEA